MEMLTERLPQCPQCGEEHFVETIESKYNGIILIVTYKCSECGQIWRRYYKADYVGYAIGSRVFAVDGTCVMED